MKTLKPFIFSCSLAFCISITFLLITFWIVFQYSGDPQALKTAFSTSSNYFSGLCTLVAAIVAAYLFNDWRDQHNKNIEAQFATEIMDLTCESNLQLLQGLNAIEAYVQKIGNTNTDNFKNAFQNLHTVRDTLIGIICPKVHIIVSKEDYANHFFPLIIQITDKLEIYIKSLHKCMKGGIYKDDPSYQIYFNETFKNTEDLKQQFDQLFLMLQPYVKVSEQQY